MISSCDLTLSAVLNDPMISALRAADGIDTRVFERFLRDKAVDLEAARGPAPLPHRAVAAPNRNWLPRVCFA